MNNIFVLEQLLKRIVIELQNLVNWVIWHQICAPLGMADVIIISLMVYVCVEMGLLYCMETVNESSRT